MAYASDENKLYIGTDNGNIAPKNMSDVPSIKYTTLYENADGYSSTYNNFMTADPSKYDHFLIETQDARFAIYKAEKGGYGYIQGGTNTAIGGSDFSMLAVSFGVDSKNNWMMYDSLKLTYIGTWTFAAGRKIYKIMGVQYAHGEET